MYNLLLRNSAYKGVFTYKFLGGNNANLKEPSKEENKGSSTSLLSQANFDSKTSLHHRQ
jgi:hypothetical protein